MAVPAGVVHEVDPTDRAFRVTVYYLASAMLVDWANSIVRGVDADKVIRLGVVLVGVYVTWYSIAVAPQSALGVAVKDFVVVAPMITFWLTPAT